MAAQVIQKFGREHCPSVGVLQVAQILDLVILEISFGDPIHECFQTSVDAITGLMDAVIGVGTEEIIELSGGFVDAQAMVNLRHGQLVKISKKHTFGK